MKHHPRAASRLAALPLGIACALAASGVAAQEGPAGEAQTLDRVTVTGSRLKRADIEGAVPVTVIDRATIDASGDISVAELLRDSSFAAFGSFRPRSGSSAQAVSEVDMRGIGADRTLVLVDADDLCVSNTNRQLPALEGQYGRGKAQVLAERCRAINPRVEARPVAQFLTAGNLESLLGEGFDLVVDACDSFRTKVEAIAWCRRRKQQQAGEQVPQGGRIHRGRGGSWGGPGMIAFAMGRR